MSDPGSEACSRSADCRSGTAPAATPCAPSTASRSRSAAARPSAWSASRAAASRPWAAASSACCRPTRASPARCSTRAATSSGWTPTSCNGLRGPELGLIFQEPMTRLDPLHTIESHFLETLRAHRSDLDKDEMRKRSLETLAKMGIPPTRFKQYPHEFSGGMRQRIMIALALVLEPSLLVADEPTTALDVIVEAQILGILADLRENFDTGLLLITHNLGIVAEACDRVAVMYAGRIAEEGDARRVFAEPAHPYTRELLRSIISLSTTELNSIPGAPPNLIDPPPGCRFHPRCPNAMRRLRQSQCRSRSAPKEGQRVQLLAARARGSDPDGGTRAARARRDRGRGGGLDGGSETTWPAIRGSGAARGPRPEHPIRASAARSSTGCAAARPGSVHAVDGVSFDLRRGEVLGVVGESGSGKTTLGPHAARSRPRRARARSSSRDARSPASTSAEMRPICARRLQIVFQDPHASLNPAMTIGASVGDPLRFHGIASGREDRERRVAAALERVGLAAGRAVRRQVPGRPVGRAEAARRPRPRGDPRARRADRRRAGLDARHERAGEDPRADDRAQGRARPHLRLHHPRPRDGEVLLRPDRDHVPRTDRRARAREADLRRPQAPVHPGTAEGDPRARPDPRGAARPAPRRGPRRRLAAARLPLPSPLQVRVRGLRLGEPRPADADRGALDADGGGGIRGRAGTDRRHRRARRPVDRGASSPPRPTPPRRRRCSTRCAPRRPTTRSGRASPRPSQEAGGVRVRFHEGARAAPVEVDENLVECHLHDPEAIAAAEAIRGGAPNSPPAE